MKSTTILIRATSLAISSAIICLLMLTACGNRAGDQVENKNPGTARNEGSAIPANSATPATSDAPKDQAMLPTTQTSTTQTSGENKSRVASAPQPQVGTGGSDFFLFTQARAALAADAELKTENIVIDVKTGLVTLSGTVANAEQKSKAEQLVHAVNGVRAVKNQLQISLANAKAAPPGE